MDGRGILEILVMGLVVGVVARLVVPGRHRLGLLGTIAVGVAGAFLGWWIGRGVLGPSSVREHPWIWATIGSILLVLVVAAIANRRSTPRRMGRRL